MPSYSILYLYMFMNPGDGNMNPGDGNLKKASTMVAKQERTRLRNMKKNKRWGGYPSDQLEHILPFENMYV